VKSILVCPRLVKLQELEHQGTVHLQHHCGTEVIGGSRMLQNDGVPPHASQALPLVDVGGLIRSSRRPVRDEAYQLSVGKLALSRSS
jgi:hypothetical protein